MPSIATKLPKDAYALDPTPPKDPTHSRHERHCFSNVLHRLRGAATHSLCTVRFSTALPHGTQATPAKSTRHAHRSSKQLGSHTLTLARWRICAAAQLDFLVYFNRFTSVCIVASPRVTYYQGSVSGSGLGKNSTHYTKEVKRWIPALALGSDHRSEPLHSTCLPEKLLTLAIYPATSPTKKEHAVS